MIANAITVDVEDWFHILDVEGVPGLDRWDHLESRVEAATERLMDLLDEAGVQGTFFVLGWVAERHPALVTSIDGRGHEVASHGHSHELLAALGRTRFQEETRRAKGALEDLLGKEVEGYRAAGFSLTRECLWAIDVLAEEGFRYDSSVFPAPRAHGGLDVPRQRAFRLQGPGGGSLWEFPLPPVAMGPLRVAFSGGGYLRLWPLWFLRWAERRLNQQQVPVVYYIHPREVDREQPRMALPWVRRFKYYVNLESTPSKLRSLLRPDRGRRFTTLRDQRLALEGSDGMPRDAPLRPS